MTMAVAPQPSSSTIVLEISVISTEGLNNYTSYFNPTIKPFITITKLPTPTHVDVVDDGGGGGLSPTSSTWDHKFRVPVDPTFFSDGYSCLHLQIFTKRRIVGPAQIGWCLIPPSDIGLIPPGCVRYLSYRLRARDGSRGHAIINISVRLEGLANVYFDNNNNNNVPWVAPIVDAGHTVIGIPVTAIRRIGNGDCSRANTNTTVLR